MNSAVLLLVLNSFAVPNDPVRQDVVVSRSYLGGPDEEDLRVQPQVVPPIRKLDAKSIQIQVLKTSGKADAVEESPQGE